MGGVSSKWTNQNAVSCASFAVALFGKPSVYSAAASGFAVWHKADMAKATLFGGTTCFDSIIVKDESVQDDPQQTGCMYICVVVPVSQTALCSLYMIPGCGYDVTQKRLWIRACCMDMCIASLKAATDFIAGTVDISTAIANRAASFASIMGTTDAATKVGLVKPLYTAACQNLVTISSQASTPVPASSSSELFSDDPWYGAQWPYYSSSDPGSIALGESWEDKYYTAVPFYNSIERLSGCKGTCQDISKLNKTLDNIDLGARPRPYLKERFAVDLSMPLTLKKGLRLFETRKPRTKEGMKNLLSLSAHTSRLEHLTVGQAYNLFSPKTPLNKANALKLERLKNKKLSVGQAYALFQPKKGTSAEALVAVPTFKPLFTPPDDLRQLFQ